MTNQKVYLIFWDWRAGLNDPTFSAPPGSEEEIEGEFNGSAGAPWVGVANQYRGAAGVMRTVNGRPPYLFHPDQVPGGMLGGVTYDNTHAIASYSEVCRHHTGNELCPTAAGIVAVLAAARATFGYPDPANSLYLILLPPHAYSYATPRCTDWNGCDIFLPLTCNTTPDTPTDPCFDNPRAEHASVTLPGESTSTVYGLVTFQVGAAGATFSGLGQVAYHEALEAMTDAAPGLGWVATAPSGKILSETWWENMDPCEGAPLMSVQAQPSTYPNHGLIEVPAQWSNRSFQNGGCTYRYTRHATRWSVTDLGALREEFLDDPDGAATATGTYHTFAPWGASLAAKTQLSVVNWTYDRVDLFGLDTAGAILHAATWWDRSATSLAAERFTAPDHETFSAPPSVASQGFGQLSVFVVGQVVPGFSLLLYKSYDYATGWVPAASNDWTVLPSPWTPASQIAATAWGPKRIDLFFIDITNVLRHGWSLDGGSTWGWGNWFVDNPPGGFRGAPAVASWGDQRLDLFAVGGDGNLYHHWWDHYMTGGSWERWPGSSGTLTGTPTVAALGDQRLHIEALDIWGVIEQIDYDWALKPWSYASGTYRWGAAPGLAAW
jgi:hypothetical protein